MSTPWKAGSIASKSVRSAVRDSNPASDTGMRSVPVRAYLSPSPFLRNVAMRPAAPVSRTFFVSAKFVPPQLSDWIISIYGGLGSSIGMRSSVWVTGFTPVSQAFEQMIANQRYRRFGYHRSESAPVYFANGPV